MAVTKQVFTLMDPTGVPAGTTKASPVIGSEITAPPYGGHVSYKITNGSSAPTLPCVIIIQVSPDKTKWYDYQYVVGDSVSSSVTSGSIKLDMEIMNVRVVAYGNTVTTVTVEAYLQAITGV